MTENAIAKRSQNWASAMVENPAFQDRVKSALSSVFTPQMFNAVMVQALLANPVLQKCEPASVYAALLKCGRLGVQPLGQVDGGWLIPRKGKAELQLSYDGLIRIVTRAVPVMDIRASVVRANDSFDYEPASPEPIKHKVDPMVASADRGDIVGAWAQIRTQNGGVYPTFLRVEEINRRRDIGHGGPAWRNHYESMALKTAMHDAFRFVPKDLATGAADMWRAVREDNEVLDDDEPNDGEWQESEDRDPRSAVDAFVQDARKEEKGNV